jgi:hypothetical protein
MTIEAREELEQIMKKDNGRGYRIMIKGFG